MVMAIVFLVFLFFYQGAAFDAAFKEYHKLCPPISVYSKIKKDIVVVWDSCVALKYLHSPLKCKSEANGFHGILTLTEAAAELEATASDALEGYFAFPPCHRAIIVQRAPWPRDI